MVIPVSTVVGSSCEANCYHTQDVRHFFEISALRFKLLYIRSEHFARCCSNNAIDKKELYAFAGIFSRLVFVTVSQKITVYCMFQLLPIKLFQPVTQVFVNVWLSFAAKLSLIFQLNHFNVRSIHVHISPEMVG